MFPRQDLRSPEILLKRFLVASMLLVCVTACIRKDPDPSREKKGFSSRDCVTVGLRWEPRTFNPFRSVDSASYFAQSLVYSGLLRYGGMGQIEPDLASSFTILKSDSSSDRTYRFVLREDIFFSDGSKITVDDVVRSIKEACGPRSPFRNNFQLLKKIDSQDRQILVTFGGQDVSLPSRFVDLKILPARILDGGKDFNWEREPISSGVFKVKQWRSGQQIVFERNPGYWDKKSRPDYRQLFWRVIPDKKLLAMALLRNEIDMASLDGREASRLMEQFSDLQVERIKGARVVFLGFNLSKWPYTDKSVRQSLSMMIDRKAINEKLFGDFSHVPESEFSENKKLATTVNLAAAFRKLKATGFELENDRWVQGGRPMSLRVVTVSDFLDIGQAIVSDLKRGAVEAELEVVEYSTLKDQYLKEGNFDLVLFSRSVGPVPDPRMFWSTTGSLNYSKYHNPRMDKLIAYGSQSASIEEKQKYNLMAGKLIAEDLPWIYLARPDLLIVHNRRIKKVVIGNQRLVGIPWNNEVQNARFWKIAP